MLGKQLLGLTCACVAAVLPAAAARGDFVNGVETFQSPSIDTSAWVVEWPHTLRTGPDGLNILLPEMGSEISTRSVTVGVGESAEAVVRVNRYLTRAGDNMPGVVALALATNNAALKYSYHADSEYLVMESVEVFNGIQAWDTNGTSFVSNVLRNHQPQGSTYAYRISRTSPTSALFEVLEDGRVLGSATRTFTELPDELFVSIYGADIDMTVRSVTVVPEPSAVCMMAAAGALLLRRRRDFPKR